MNCNESHENGYLTLSVFFLDYQAFSPHVFVKLVKMLGAQT